MMIADQKLSLLTPLMLQRFDERAPVYDRENRFFTEDFEELRASGYLSATLPTDLGGAGLTLAEVNALQRRVAYHAPATALAVNMHLYWLGLAADLRRIGEPSADSLERIRNIAPLGSDALRCGSRVTGRDPLHRCQLGSDRRGRLSGRRLPAVGGRC
jgi:alkylation response protein AidB-like acyl-CoA dehydrogenase